MKKSRLLIPALFGAIILAQMVSTSRLDSYRAVDVVELIAIGMCFGAALAGLVLILRKRWVGPGTPQS